MVVAHTYNQHLESKGRQVQGEPGLHRKILSILKKKKVGGEMSFKFSRFNRQEKRNLSVRKEQEQSFFFFFLFLFPFCFVFGNYYKEHIRIYLVIQLYNWIVSLKNLWSTGTLECGLFLANRVPEEIMNLLSAWNEVMDLVWALNPMTNPRYTKS